MPQILLVMLGGAIGAGFRFHVGSVALRNLGPGYPYGTLLVNLIGGFLMGILVGTLAKAPLAGGQGEPLRLFLGVGVLGGFTTFSAFSLETVTMLMRGEPIPAVTYTLASVAGSVLMLLAGLLLARTFG